ncbi:MAG: SDR family oxidoreductase [Gammaproteobacteria bacterium]|nr:MAG: SDR family oxidoreductase [Gammaproteobacteria bacterium]
MAAEGQIVLSGGASGIGRAIVERLVREGRRVCVLDRDEAGLAALAEAMGAAIATAAVDISDFEAVGAAVSEFVGQGPIRGLVNNAGWDESTRFIDTDPAFWRKVIDINLYGPLNLTHAVLPHLVNAGGGRVVSIASDAGRVGSSGEAVYSAAKGGTIALMKTLAREHARDGITFNSVCPGPTDTPLLEAVDPTGKLQSALERAVPMRRLATPEDFPGLVSFLLSEEAGYITGQTISVSGGLSMHG